MDIEHQNSNKSANEIAKQTKYLEIPGKITFIRYNQLFLVEIQPLKDWIIINNMIACTLSQDGKAPIKVSNVDKMKVIKFLENNYKCKSKEINRIIAFFNRLNDGEYFYIYPSAMNMDEIDIYKESLKYYNAGMDDNKVAKEMKTYFEHLKIIEDLMPINYSIQYHKYSKIQRFGESDKCKRICIYCGKGMKDGAKFKEDAHAVPEALGNKTLIQYEECDDCNDYFSRYMEEDLANYLSFNRILYSIKGKNGNPTMEFGKKSGKYFDFTEINCNTDLGRFNIIKQLLNIEELRNFKGAIIINDQNDLKNGSLSLPYVKPVIPLHIYKTMCKIVIGLVGKEQLVNFEQTIKWLRIKNDCTYEKLPKVAVCRTAPAIAKEPEVIIYLRNVENKELPYCFAELRVANMSFVYIIPFSCQDEKKFLSQEEFDYFWEKQEWYKKFDYSLEDFSSNESIEINFIINFNL